MKIDFPTFLGIASVSILCIFATSMMVFENDSYSIDATDSSSQNNVKRDAEVLSEINQWGSLYQKNKDAEKFEKQMKLMQAKQKDIASRIFGLNISEAYVAEGWNFPFREPSEVTVIEPEFKKPICDIPKKIPIHMQKIRQSDMFQVFVGKYSQHHMMIDISDERNFGLVHYGLIVTSDDGLFYASTHFHLDTCTDEMKWTYFLLCKDIKNDEHISTRIKSEITASLENKEFCNIKLEPWHQGIRDYQTKISNELERLTQETVTIDSDGNRFHLEFKRLGLLLDITRYYDSGVLEPEKLQEDLQEYERVFGSLPDELLKLLEEKNEN